MAVKRSQSASRALTVLEAVAARQPVGVSELARRLETNKSAVQRALMTLADDGWIRALPGARWELAPRMLAMARVPHSVQDLRRRARDVLERLRDAINETVYVIMPDDRRFVIVEALECHHLLRLVSPIGMVVPVIESATGRAILAFCDEARRADMLGREPEPALLDEFALVRRRGYAISNGDVDPGSVSVAAPVFGPGWEPIAAVVVAGPRARLTPERHAETGELAARAAASLSLAEVERA